MYVKEIKDPETGVKMQLLNPIVIQIRQSQVILAYPFKYISAVNGKASEIVINDENRKNYTGCDDSSLISPTCGIKYEKGVPIPFSEGFCCFCPEKAVKMTQTRGGQDCSKEVDLNDIDLQKKKASAHCLHFSDIWYSVNALSDPLIFHDVSVQVFNERYLQNGTAAWVSLTNFEKFELGFKNPSQFDQNKTIVITYYTEIPRNDTLVLSADNNRLLIPQPMPGLDYDKLPPPVKNGAPDYLLISKSVIAPNGKVCDTAGVAYEGFARQEDRCNIPKNSCLKNQPLDLWETDNEKRKAKQKGKYLLENYGTPRKNSIVIDRETNEHWLALEYYEKQKTILNIEFSADRIVALTPGKHAQISSVTSASVEKKILFYVIVSNKDLSPATFSVKVSACEYEVPDSNNVSKVVPPQRRETFEVQTVQGKFVLAEKFSCTVVVDNINYGTVAERRVLIKPMERCICNMHCRCACVGESLVCVPMKQEDYLGSGFRGSLPVLTAQPKHKAWVVHHPFLFIFALFLILLLLGMVKGILGVMGFSRIRDMGLELLIYGKRQLKFYIEVEIQDFPVITDLQGYPVHPITKEPVRVLKEKEVFCLNIVFFIIYPFLRLIEKMNLLNAGKPPPVPPVDFSNSDETFDDFSDEDQDDDFGAYPKRSDSKVSLDFHWLEKSNSKKKTSKENAKYEPGRPSFTKETMDTMYENVETKTSKRRSTITQGGRDPNEGAVYESTDTKVYKRRSTVAQGERDGPSEGAVYEKEDSKVYKRRSTIAQEEMDGPSEGAVYENEDSKVYKRRSTIAQEERDLEYSKEDSVSTDADTKIYKRRSTVEQEGKDPEFSNEDSLYPNAGSKIYKRRSTIEQDRRDSEYSNLQTRGSKSDTVVTKEKDKNPDPVNKELERWQKGKDRIQAVGKPT